MRLASQLNRDDLEAIVASIQAYFYLDVDEDDQSEIWNPDKVCSGADCYDRVVQVLDCHGLVPYDVEPFEQPASGVNESDS